MKNTEYNGWTNRSTWLVNLHFEFNSIDELEGIKEHIKESFYEFDTLMIDQGNLFVQDFVESPDFHLINWDELADSIDKQEYSGTMTREEGNE